MGYNGNASAGDVNTLDPDYRPERTDNFNISLQRELRQNMMLELGYIGRIIRNEMQELNLDDVPYMTTLDGQSFAQAYANVYNSMVGNGVAPGSVAASRSSKRRWAAREPYCSGYASCTAAVATKLTSTFKSTGVSDMWAALNKAASWTLGRTMISGAGGGVSPLQATSLALTTSMGFGNYNAMYAYVESYQLTTAQPSFPTSPGAARWARRRWPRPTAPIPRLDAWNMQANYGPNGFDVKLLFTTRQYTYAPPYFKGQHGLEGPPARRMDRFTAVYGAERRQLGGAYYSEGTCGSYCESFGESSSGSMTSTADYAVGSHQYTGNARRLQQRRIRPTPALTTRPSINHVRRPGRGP